MTVLMRFFSDLIQTLVSLRELSRTLKLGYENGIQIWPGEAFRKGLCAYKVIWRRVFIVSDPALIEYVMLTRVENFRKSDAAREMLEPLIGESMFITHGEHWRRQRRIATPAFHSRHVRAFVPTFAKETSTLVAEWGRMPAGTLFDVNKAMTALTARIICRTLFGHDMADTDSQRVFEAFDRYQDSFGRMTVNELIGLPTWVPRRGRRKGHKAAADIDEVVDAIIANRRKTGEVRTDLLGLLMSANAVDGQGGMSDQLLRDELKFLFLAGHETTASVMTWIWFLLSRAPKAEARLYKEISGVLGDDVPDFDALSRMPWLRAVLQEVMRLYPPVHVYARQAVEDDKLWGKVCPAGSIVVVAPWVVHRHQLLWDAPNRFLPERFLPENDAKRPRYAWLPFSAGPRTCLGMGFAMAEMMAGVATIMQRFRLEVPPEHDVVPLGRLTLRPAGGLPVRLHPRDDMAAGPVGDKPQQPADIKE